MSDENGQMPIGWEQVPLADVTSHSKSKAEPSEFGKAKYIGLENIESGSNQITGFGDTSAVKSTKAVFHAGDVLYGKLRPYLKKVCRPQFDGICSTDILVYPQREHLDNGYLLHFLSQQSTSEFATQNANGINLPRISPKTLGEIIFPTPPLAEQRRIVAKIEALQERSRAAREALAEVKPLLEQFRQSVLAAAFRGDLTADWRKQNPHVEPATKLLERIRKERRQKWEQTELAKYEAKGKKPPKNWQDKYKEPETVDDGGLPDLPDCWSWANLATIAEIQSGVTLGSKKKKGQDYISVPYLRVANVQRGFLNLSEIKKVEVTHEKAESLMLQSGDVLFNEGGDRDKLGRGWVWNNEVEGCIHQNHVYRARLLSRDFMPELISHYANEFGRDYFFRNASQSVNLASINKTQLSGLPVPVIPAAEQVVLLESLNDLLSACDDVDAEISSSKSALTQLDQSILAKAFRGELVPQDPNDEPASVLLERIREQREAQAATKKKGKKPSRGRGKKKEATQSKASPSLKLTTVQFTKSILTLLTEWEKPVSIRLIEPALQLYHDADLRNRILNDDGTNKPKSTKQRLTANAVHQKLPTVLGKLRGKKMIKPAGDDHYQIGDISTITITTTEETEAREAIETLEAYIEAKEIADELVAERVAESAGGRLHVVEVV